VGTPPTGTPSRTAIKRQKEYVKHFTNMEDFNREVANTMELIRIDPDMNHFIYGHVSENKTITMPYGGKKMLDCLPPYDMEPPNVNTLICWFSEVVIAINLLHMDGFIHQDIRMPNILINNDNHAKVIDFNTMMKPEDKLSIDLKEDFSTSPYYPPCYTLPGYNFVNVLKHFTIYNYAKAGDLLQLYLHIHDMTEQNLTSLVSKHKGERKYVDYYSLGIIMLESYILIKKQHPSYEFPPQYLQIAKELTTLVKFDPTKTTRDLLGLCKNAKQ
jgi:serine/threonine protein kinase